MLHAFVMRGEVIAFRFAKFSFSFFLHLFVCVPLQLLWFSRATLFFLLRALILIFPFLLLLSAGQSPEKLTDIFCHRIRGLHKKYLARAGPISIPSQYATITQTVTSRYCIFILVTLTTSFTSLFICTLCPWIIFSDSDCRPLASLAVLPRPVICFHGEFSFLFSVCLCITLASLRPGIACMSTFSSHVFPTLAFLLCSRSTTS